MGRAVISYIPALHQGYFNFFKEQSAPIFVLGREFVLETPRMERDIRALDPTLVAKALSAVGFKAQVLESSKMLSDLKLETIVMPDEDVNRNFASAYLGKVKVGFVPTFLRWDGNVASKQFKIPADRQVSVKQFDREMIRTAEQEARKSPDWWRQIGAVVIAKDGQRLTAHNRPLPQDDYSLGAFGDPRSNFDYGQSVELTTALHAEAALIAEAAKRGLALNGASIYVSTFPCPVCAKSLAAAGIKKVYYNQGYSLLDAEDILKAHNIELVYVDMKIPPSA